MDNKKAAIILDHPPLSDRQYTRCQIKKLLYDSQRFIELTASKLISFKLKGHFLFIPAVRLASIACFSTISQSILNRF